MSGDINGSTLDDELTILDGSYSYDGGLGADTFVLFRNEDGTTPGSYL